jgi:hypothetical protein
VFFEEISQLEVSLDVLLKTPFAFFINEMLFEKDCKKSPSKRRFTIIEKNTKEFRFLDIFLHRVDLPSKISIKVQTPKPFL